MVYNELEQEDTLSCVRVRLATIAYLDILLCSIWAIHKIRQSPITMTIQEVRTKAREGGYHHDAQRQAFNIRVGVLGSHALRTIRVDDIFLDPHFWRALGVTR